MRRAEMFLHLLCRFISILPTTGGANGPRMYVKNRVDRVLRKTGKHSFSTTIEGRELNKKNSIYSINTSLVSPKWVLIIVLGKH